MRRVTTDLPERADTIIVGGGTSGAALAGLLARDTDRAVLLLEAGPDYGPLAEGGWPAPLLDARRLPEGHDWGFSGLAHRAQAGPVPFARARVIGGCSAHNGCVALLGHRRDYDGWAERGNQGWDWASVAPAFARARAALRVRLVADEDLTPFHAAALDGATAIGIPRVRDLNDPDQDEGAAAAAVNIWDGVRWNSALAYLDPVRSRRNLTVCGDAPVERVEVRGGRATAVWARVGGERRRVAAGRIALAGGAYGSPALLLRSGIGPADDLRRLGIPVARDLPGVGRGLADHPMVPLRFRGSAALDAAMARAATGWLPDEQVLIKARSGRCREAFDLHLYGVSAAPAAGAAWDYTLWVAAVCPTSAGTLTLASADPDAPPILDHGYLSHPDGADLDVLLDGIALARAIAAGAPGGALTEVGSSAGLADRAALAAFVERSVGYYYHPACSCRMGPADDPLAVVDRRGRVRGVDDLFVCDASIFPTLMRANTNLPAAMVAEHLAGWIGA